MSSQVSSVQRQVLGSDVKGLGMLADPKRWGNGTKVGHWCGQNVRSPETKKIGSVTLAFDVRCAVVLKVLWERSGVGIETDPRGSRELVRLCCSQNLGCSVPFNTGIPSFRPYYFILYFFINIRILLL